MGTYPIYRPNYLGDKLKMIRVKILGNISYVQMAKLLACPHSKPKHNSVIYYEDSKRVPPLDILLKYSQLSGISVNDLIDDDVLL